MNRRRFTRASVVAGIGACGLIPTRALRAAGGEGSLQALTRSHPPAEALKYVDDASDADASVYPADTAQNCANCRHYQGGDAPEGGCALYQGFSVQASGWCTGWVAR